MRFPELNSKGLVAAVSIFSLLSSADAWLYAAHNAIQSLAASTSNAVTTRFQPVLRVENGCVPFPAIDLVDTGRCSGGLGIGGAINGQCGSSTGQVYARSGTIDGRFGILYTWYFPKDQILLGPFGHRHDWESFVIFFNTDTPTAASNILAICPSRHGSAVSNYHCDLSSTNSLKLSGLRPKIVYKPDGTHAVFTYSGTSGLGGGHPLVNWESLPALGKQILTEADFGDANVPLNDARWEMNMRNAKAAAGL